MVEREYYLKKARGTGREVYWSTYKRLRNDVTRKIRHSKTTYTHSVFKENISHPKQFWNQIKRSYFVKQQKQVPSDLFMVNGNLATDSNEIANGFFAEISKKLRLLFSGSQLLAQFGSTIAIHV